MTEEQWLVHDFHKAFGLTINNIPVLDEAETEVSYELIREETEEIRQAIEDGDLIAVADGLADLLYVTYGAALRFGIDLEFIFKEVHRSNMTKVGGYCREDGKWVKPDTYEPAELEEILVGQGWSA